MCRLFMCNKKFLETDGADKILASLDRLEKECGGDSNGFVTVKNGKVTHYQNDVKVLSYKLWGEEWINLLQSSKFSEKNWPLAFELLKNCGGDGHKGYFGFQDHGDEVWFRNIRVKVLK